MITYAERTCFSPQQLRILARVVELVGRVSNSWGNELRCHELCRAVHHALGLSGLIVVDGKCGPIEHSWLVLSDGAILDPYAPGRVPAVQIVDPLAGLLYQSSKSRKDIQRSVVRRLLREMLTGEECAGTRAGPRTSFLGMAAVQQPKP